MTRSGVLLMGFGGPSGPDDVAPFMSNLMGRQPSPEAVTRAMDKYLAIGGASPLLEVTKEMVEALGERLGPEVPVGVGMRYWHPYIADMLAAMADAGVTRVVAISLSPFESKVATGAYRDAIADALRTLTPLEVVEAPHMGGTPDLTAFFEISLREGLEDLKDLGGENPLIVFTAHSLPLSELVEEDPYVVGLEKTARDIAEGHGMGAPERLDGTGRLPGIEALGSMQGEKPWVFAYQSKGSRPGEWLGPDLESVLRAAAAGGFGSVIVVPIGFLTDHMETRYDLDVEAASLALDLGLEWVRTEVPNASTQMMDAIAALARQFL